MGRIVEQPNITVDYSTIKNILDFVPVYHADEDTFFLRSERPEPAVSLDWDGDIWLRIKPDSGEIVGMEVEDFESVFLRKYPELGIAWREVKPLCRRRKQTAPEKANWQAFVRIILDFLQNLTKERPQQAQFSLSPHPIS